MTYEPFVCARVCVFFEEIHWKCYKKCKQKRATCILVTLLLAEIFNIVRWSCICFNNNNKKRPLCLFLQHLTNWISQLPSTMFKIVPDLLKSRSSIHYKIFRIKSVIILLSLNACLKFCAVIAGPSIQQEQELLLLEALSKRQPSYYGTSNSLMDILGRSMIYCFCSRVFF